MDKLAYNCRLLYTLVKLFTEQYWNVYWDISMYTSLRYHNMLKQIFHVIYTIIHAASLHQCLLTYTPGGAECTRLAASTNLPISHLQLQHIHTIVPISHPKHSHIYTIWRKFASIWQAYWIEENVFWLCGNQQQPWGFLN